MGRLSAETVREFRPGVDCRRRLRCEKPHSDGRVPDWCGGSAAQAAYYPPAGQWAHKTPAEVGMDPAKLNDAVEFMKSHETATPKRDFRTRKSTWASCSRRCRPSEAEAQASSFAAVTSSPSSAIRSVRSDLQRCEEHARHRRRNRPRPRADSEPRQPGGDVVKDGGYDSPQNSRVTWRNHLQQESEWEGEMWGKNANFLGREAFGAAEMKPRAIRAPGHATNTTTSA